jgi:hypothetical protein
VQQCGGGIDTASADFASQHCAAGIRSSPLELAPRSDDEHDTHLIDFAGHEDDTHTIVFAEHEHDAQSIDFTGQPCTAGIVSSPSEFAPRSGGGFNKVPQGAANSYTGQIENRDTALRVADFEAGLGQPTALFHAAASPLISASLVRTSAPDGMWPTMTEGGFTDISYDTKKDALGVEASPKEDGAPSRAAPRNFELHPNHTDKLKWRPDSAQSQGGWPELDSFEPYSCFLPLAFECNGFFVVAGLDEGRPE